MFDFFRDTYLELSGIDSDLAKLERAKKEEEKKSKNKRIVIPNWIKKFIMTISVLYLISCFGTFQIIWKSGNILLIIRSAFQMVLAVMIFVLMLYRNKKAEIAGLVAIVIFFILQYSGLLMFWLKS